MAPPARLETKRTRRAHLLRAGTAGAGLLAGAALAACRQGAASTGETPSRSGQPATVFVNNGWISGDRAKVADAWFALSTKKRPNVKLEIDQTGGALDKHVTLFASDQQGDLIFLSPYLVPVLGPKNALADIGPTLAALKFDANKVYDDPVVERQATWHGDHVRRHHLDLQQERLR